MSTPDLAEVLSEAEAIVQRGETTEGDLVCLVRTLAECVVALDDRLTRAEARAQRAIDIASSTSDFLAGAP